MAGNVWAVSSLGGFTFNDPMTTEFRKALQPECKFRQFSAIQSAYGTGMGENYHWNVYLNVTSQGGTLVETNTMPESNIRISQGTLTVNEYGQGVPYTAKLESLGRDSIRKPIVGALKDDAKKAFDFMIHTQFNNTLLRLAPSGGTSTTTLAITTNGTCTTTNNIVFQKEHARLVYDTMRERNVPHYTANEYMAIAWPTTLRRLKNDIESVRQYTSEGFGMIMSGEVGRYENIRFIEQTNVAKGYAPVNGGATATAWANGNDWIYFFGKDTVMEGVVEAEQIRGKLPGDYGRSKGVAWYYLGGAGIVHANTSFTEQARIFKWDTSA